VPILKGVDLVTGAMGFSASHLVRHLLARGRKVVGLDLPDALHDTARRAMLATTGIDWEHPDLALVPGNLLEPTSLDDAFASPVERVFHVASLYDYSASLERLRAVNVHGTIHLVEKVLDRGVDRFVHWSTCGVFGKPWPARFGRKNNLPFSEDSSSPKNAAMGAAGPEGTHLVNAYSVSKWEQEQYIWQMFREEGLPVTVIRPAPIYGPGSDYGHGGIILAIAKGYLPAIPRDARNYITTSVHVEDLARFACGIAERPDAVGEDYNVVDNSIISYHEFLHYIALLTGRRMVDLPVITQPMLRPLAQGLARAWTAAERRLGIPRVRVLEVQSATYMASSYWLSNRKSLATGFEYVYPDVREGLKDTVAWMREVGWL